MRTWLLLLLCAVLAACAGPHGLAQRPDAFFDDSLFAAPAERVSADDVFALSEPMLRYLQHPQVEAQLRRKGSVRGLLDALYNSGELRLDYDTTLLPPKSQIAAATAM